VSCDTIRAHSRGSCRTPRYTSQRTPFGQVAPTAGGESWGGGGYAAGQGEEQSLYGTQLATAGPHGDAASGTRPNVELSDGLRRLGMVGWGRCESA
jgi:hypothetical protein